MQVENLTTLSKLLKDVGGFLLKSYFLLYSIGLLIFTSALGSSTIFDLINNLPFQLTIALGSVFLAYYFINRDVTRWKKQWKMQEKPKRAYAIMLVLFLFISLYTEIIFYVIGNIELMVDSIGTKKMKEDGELRFDQAHIASFALMYNFIIFTEGKRIWKWITKRDSVIDRINEELYSIKPIC